MIKLTDGTPVNVLKEAEGWYLIWSPDGVICSVHDCGNCYTFEHCEASNVYVRDLMVIDDYDLPLASDIVASYCDAYNI